MHWSWKMKGSGERLQLPGNMKGPQKSFSLNRLTQNQDDDFFQKRLLKKIKLVHFIKHTQNDTQKGVLSSGSRYFHLSPGFPFLAMHLWASYSVFLSFIFLF